MDAIMALNNLRIRARGHCIIYGGDGVKWKWWYANWDINFPNKFKIMTMKDDAVGINFINFLDFSIIIYGKVLIAIKKSSSYFIPTFRNLEKAATI